MGLINSSQNRTNAKNAKGLARELQSLKPIRIPKGGAYRNKTRKLREAGILGPKETIEEYNARLPQPNEPDSDSVISPNLEGDLPQAETIELEPQGETTQGGFGGLLSRATQALKDDSQKLTTQSKKVTPKAREDFSVLVVSVITLLVAVAKVPEQVKPNGDEINLFSEHLSGIMLRHLPINNKLSADALDVIGLIAVTASWYSRVHSDLRIEGRTEAKEPQPATQPQVRKNGHVPQTPIEVASPEAGNWLNNIAARSEGAL